MAVNLKELDLSAQEYELILWVLKLFKASRLTIPQ